MVKKKDGKEATQFKPGWAGGPGRPKKTDEQKVTRKLTKLKAEELLSKFSLMDISELEAILKDKSRSVLEHWIGRICLIGIKGGDERKLNFMFERLIGKVKDEIEVTVPRPMIVERWDGAPKLLGSTIEGEIVEEGKDAEQTDSE